MILKVFALIFWQLNFYDSFEVRTRSRSRTARRSLKNEIHFNDLLILVSLVRRPSSNFKVK
jgi:hypothetical protein